MKLPKLLYYCLLLFCLVIFNQCKKEKDKTPIEQLPPETQTGANTFGCLVHGQIFKPGGAQLSGGSLQANYQYLGTGQNFFFGLRGTMKKGEVLSSVYVFVDSTKIKEGDRYELITRENGNASGMFFYSPSPLEFDYYNTNTINKGELFIAKLDTLSQIVSGTFSFKVESNSGEIFNVTYGRFDVRYTR